MMIWQDNPQYLFVKDDNIIRADEKKGTHKINEGVNIRIVSDGTMEKTPFGKIPSQLLMSDEGIKLIRQNPGLLKSIESGNLDFEKVMKGMEGIVGVVKLKIDGQEKKYCVKYATPVTKGKNQGLIPLTEDHVIYTPQIDAMRAMQKAHESSPVKNINYVVPVIATLGISVSPFIENTIMLDELKELGVKTNEYPELKDLKDSIIRHQNWIFLKTQLQSPDFTQIINPKSWPLGKMQSFITEVNQMDGMVYNSYGTGEAATTHNTIVDLQKVLSILDSLDRDNDSVNFWEYDYATNRTTESDFLQAFRQSCYVIEIIAGSVPLSAVEN